MLAITADIYANGVFTGVLNYCPDLPLDGGETDIFASQLLNWVRGQTLELRDILAPECSERWRLPHDKLRKTFSSG
ncbi:MAG: hypothetical protein IPM81_20205 [Saprospirales bacterium]|nr:hypothetical protein [Saprospirales bacterium]